MIIYENEIIAIVNVSRDSAGVATAIKYFIKNGRVMFDGGNAARSLVCIDSSRGKIAYLSSTSTAGVIKQLNFDGFIRI